MVIVDASRQIVMANQQVQHLFGYHPDELVGAEVEILVPEPFRAGHPSKFAAFAEHPEFRPMGTGRELFGQRKDGSEFPVEISLSSFTSDDESFFISTIRDITGRKRSG